MNIGIIGAGISGVLLATLLKQNDPSLNVTLIDINKKEGKKFLITGNGRCNLGNKNIDSFAYNNKNVYDLVESFPIEKQIEFYNSIGLVTCSINDLYYPYSLSAKAMVDYLIGYLKDKKARFLLSLDVIDYQVNKTSVIINTSNRNYAFDKVVFATGGLSHITLNQHPFLSIFKKHGYKSTVISSGLTSIITKENTKQIENLRVKCKVSLLFDSKSYYEEKGEVLFKKNGLSGIAIFNAESLIKRNDGKFKNATIILDLMSELSLDEVAAFLKKSNDIVSFSCLDGIFDKTLSEYIRKFAHVKNLYKFTNSEIISLAKAIKNLSFSYQDSYGYEDSQVTIGGLDFENFTDYLESKIENNVYAVGEVLDADGLCGGYNIMFALASAHRTYLSLIKTK